jgi:hypothetical protein
VARSQLLSSMACCLRGDLRPRGTRSVGCTDP